MRNSVTTNLSERFYPISHRMHHQHAAKKISGNGKKSRVKVQKRTLRTIFEKHNLEAKKKSTFIAKGIAAHKNQFSFRH